MPDRERILKGLECCIIPAELPKCEECPYAGKAGRCRTMSKMFNEAMDFLRSCRPRLLTLKELQKLPRDEETNVPVCIEQRCPVGEWTSSTCKLVGADFAIESYVELDNFYFNRKTYGRTWRAWTATPTKEQRAAEKWEA